jgi:spermidine/putrescine transport system ATP-binding protein
MNQPAVELRQVSRRFGAVTALQEVDLTVAAGEFLTLLGPSGCGKTTLLRVIGGFETPDSGLVRLAGQDMTAVPPHRRPVNTVFQNYALFPHLSVADNVAFGLRMQRVPEREIAARVAQALELVALPGLDRRRPSQLSGGQRQRVALARALICRPQVLLLDEPLAALDAKLRHAMQLELKALQRQLGVTFIFVTHDQQEALAMSDRIALFNAGRIVQLGTPESIYRHPRTAFAADFIGRANLIGAVIQSTAPEQLVCTTSDGRWVARSGGGGRASGGQVTLMVRPEHIRCSLAPLEGPNVCAARVATSVFKGAVSEVLLTLPSGKQVTAVAEQSFAPGDSVWLQIEISDLVAL